MASASPANESAWAGTVGTTGVSITVSNATLLGLEFANCAGNGASVNATALADAGSDVFVAVTGNDTKVEIATEHTLTFTPQEEAA